MTYDQLFEDYKLEKCELPLHEWNDFPNFTEWKALRLDPNHARKQAEKRLEAIEIQENDYGF